MPPAPELEALVVAPGHVRGGRQLVELLDIQTLFGIKRGELPVLLTPCPWGIDAVASPLVETHPTSVGRSGRR